MAATTFCAPLVVALSLLLVRSKLSEHRQNTTREAVLDLNRPFRVRTAALAQFSSNKPSAIFKSISTKKSNRLVACCILLLCGDIQSQPGPPKHPCGLCNKAVRENQKAIECEECLVWYHVNCTAMSAKSYENFGLDSNLVWMCNRCNFPNFSTTFLLNNLSDYSSGTTFASLDNYGEPADRPDASPVIPLGPPLFSSSPTHHKRCHQPKRKLKILFLNCNGLKGSNKQAVHLKLL